LDLKVDIQDRMFAAPAAGSGKHGDTFFGFAFHALLLFNGTLDGPYHDGH
jgi:hypothetical protein